MDRQARNQYLVKLRDRYFATYGSARGSWPASIVAPNEQRRKPATLIL